MRFVTCLGPDGVEEPAVLSADGTAVTPLRWLGLPCDTLTEAIPQLTPAVRAGLALALSAIPSVPLDAVQLQSPIPCPAQDVVCLGINYMAHSDEAEKYSADAFSTQHQDAIYFSKRVTRAVPHRPCKEAGLRVWAGRGAGPGCQRRARRADQGLCVRLHHPERRFRPRCADGPQAVVLWQKSGRLYPHRPLHRDGR